MRTVLLNADELAQCVWEMTREFPCLMADGTITPDCLLFESAAQDALLAFCEERTDTVKGLPLPVRLLVKAFIANFLGTLLQDPQQKTAQFEVPQDAPQSGQARHAIAALLRTIAPQSTTKH